MKFNVESRKISRQYLDILFRSNQDLFSTKWGSMQELDIEILKSAAHDFARITSETSFPELYGVTDGKAVGTKIEADFKEYLSREYVYAHGNAARGIDLPSVETDIKCTSIRQPQSSSPFKSASQKIYGLGYNLLVFVYEKTDDHSAQAAKLNMLHTIFIDAARTGDYQLTSAIRGIIANDYNHEGCVESIDALMEEKNIPLDEISRRQLAERIANNPPEQGVLTISNALQWRLQYGRAITIAGDQVYPNEVIELA